MASSTALVPASRLGVLLRQARIGAGRELSAFAADVGLTPAELDDLEHGRLPLDPALIERLLIACGLDPTELVPARTELVIDLDEGRIAAARSELGVDAAAGPDAVLARYLALVYRLRDLPVGTPLAFRDLDVALLGRSLALPTDDVHGRLHRLVDDGRTVVREQRRVHRQLLVPLVGVVVAATSIGTLVLVAARGTDAEPPAERAVTVVAPEIGEAVVEVSMPPVTELGPGGVVEINPEP